MHNSAITFELIYFFNNFKKYLKTMEFNDLLELHFDSLSTWIVLLGLDTPPTRMTNQVIYLGSQIETQLS